MHVGLRIVLDAPVEAVRDALRTPAGMTATAWPVLAYRSLEPDGFPDHWADGVPHAVSAALFGVLPSGRTHIDIERHEVDGIPVQVDRGGGTTGLFARMEMRHRMAATPLPDGRTLLRDRLTFRLRPRVLGLALWPGMWVVWQWRAVRMRALAPRWSRSHPPR